MNKQQQEKFDRIMQNCHLPTRLAMAKLIRKIEQDKENCFTYVEGFQEGQKENKELQKAYNLAIKEIVRLRKKLGYDNEKTKNNKT